MVGRALGPLPDGVEQRLWWIGKAAGAFPSRPTRPSRVWVFERPLGGARDALPGQSRKSEARVTVGPVGPAPQSLAWRPQR